MSLNRDYVGGVYVDCIFCSYLEKGSLITENEGAFAIYDNFPVTKGHALIIPNIAIIIFAFIPILIKINFNQSGKL